MLESQVSECVRVRSEGRSTEQIPGPVGFRPLTSNPNSQSQMCNAIVIARALGSKASDDDDDESTVRQRLRDREILSKDVAGHNLGLQVNVTISSRWFELWQNGRTGQQ